MNRLYELRLSLIILLLGLVSGCQTATESWEEVPDGEYIGLEESSDLYPDIPDDKWYYENTLTIRGDSISLHQVSVTIYGNNEKMYSVSDGGFFDYKGSIEKSEDKHFARLILKDHYQFHVFPVEVLTEADPDPGLSLEEGIEKGIYRVDSTYYKKFYRIEVKAGKLKMNGVEYQRKKN